MIVLTDKTAIVTGSSSGIGRAIARRFAAAGARVMLADLTEVAVDGGPATSALIAEAGGTAVFRRTDVSRWADVDALVSDAVALFGRLDIMVNNAATYSGTALLDTSEAQWATVLGVNLTGLFHGCKRAVQQMIGQEPRAEVRGRIINLGSQQGIVTAPHDCAYGVSKAGAIYLTRQVAVDYAADLIVCNTLSPGKVETGAPGLPTDPALLDNARRRTPWPRLGRPDDIANAALFLASDLSTYMTGSNLVVDGGWLAR